MDLKALLLHSNHQPDSMHLFSETGSNMLTQIAGQGTPIKQELDSLLKLARLQLSPKSDD